ncbi:MAG: hypothetical protein QOG41_505 [Thermoleophilaceae bacterium]|jgi:hypothetical protein|nr:hypothetical protein [Thermoleophilaceae bacterium]MEA2353451.1 hypothetical protein [Thermoleophilaceae bacterium]MEA2369221.1 hypothetical protein [Thermoleophilaceae bacterium]MEA2387732.1 hypothetical protein [Thermoleophilaceae bacterium]
MENGHAISGLRVCRRRLSGLLALVLFSAAPFVVFGRTVRDAATDFRIEFNYLVTGWGPWFLIAVGILCFVPVVVSIGRNAYSRWSLPPGIRTAYEIWGATLYLLGVLLLTQTSQIAGAF